MFYVRPTMKEGLKANIQMILRFIFIRFFFRSICASLNSNTKIYERLLVFNKKFWSFSELESESESKNLRSRSWNRNQKVKIPGAGVGIGIRK